MGFAVSQHVRAVDSDHRPILILGFETGEMVTYAVFIRENGELGRDSISNLQVEMHFDREANEWKDDWETEVELPPGAVPLGPEYPGVWYVGEPDGDDDEANGDPALPGQDLPDQGTSDSDPA